MVHRLTAITTGRWAGQRVGRAGGGRPEGGAGVPGGAGGRIDPMARYYDIDAANARVDELRPILEGLRDDRDAVATANNELRRLRETNGSSKHADELKEREDEIREIVKRMQTAVAQIDAWSVELRDIGSGLIDFPALVNGRPVWLCWRLGEGPIEWWHEHDRGFGDRKPLVELA